MEKFNWKIKDVGLSLTAVGVCIAIIQGALAGKISKKLGDVKTAYLSLSITFITMNIIAFATQGWVLYACMLPYSFSGLADPAIRAILSNKTSESEQGELQGLITSVLSIAEIIGPPFMMAVFYYFSIQQTPFYGMPFVVGSVFIFFAFLLFRKIVKKSV